MQDELTTDLSGRMLGEFILREQIGRGGYAVVYRSEQPKLQRDVVIKVLHARRRRNDAAQERFLREAQLASKLDHPYAAHVYAFGADDDGQLWLAMEFVDGAPLSAWLEEHGPMPLERFVPFFECIAQVVQTAHERGIVHRDLKPSNVMVLERGGYLFPKLLDFGIAKVSGDDTAFLSPAHAASSDDAVTARMRVTPPDKPRTRTDPNHYRLTRTGSAMGSAPYMSPEQWSNARTVGPASDIYSLGVLTYEALTGCRPFQANTTNDYYKQHLHTEMPPLGAELSPALDRVLRRALAKEPDARHRDVMELASDLRAVLRTQPREQLRSSAQQWGDRARPPALLWGADARADLDRWAQQGAAAGLSELECSFVAASQRRARRAAWLRRALLALVALGALGALQLRSMVQAHTAEQVAAEAELEQGRQALLHGESNDAVLHLERAYQRGDRSPGVEFMLARALQPRMAERARLAGGSGRMWSAMFAPDGKRVLTTDDTSARMWDAASSQLLFTMNHGDIVYQAMFTPDGSEVVTASGDGTVRIWNATTGAPIRELTQRDRDARHWRYYALAISSHMVAAIDMMGRAAHVWDAETGSLIAELDNEAADSGQLAFSADGRWLATSGGSEVRVFDTATWRRVVTIPGPRVRRIAFDPTGPRIVVGTYGGAASIWELPSGTRLRCLRASGESVEAVAYSPDGASVAAATRDGNVQVWEASSGGLRSQLASHHAKPYAVEFASTGDLLLSAGSDGAVVVSNIVTGMPVARLEGPTNLVLAAHFDKEARRVVGASRDGTSRVWALQSSYQRWTMPPVGSDCDTVDQLSPDQRFVALSCRQHGTRVWDTARGELLTELPPVTEIGGDYYSALPAVSADGDRAAIARGSTVEVYALPSGQLLRTISHPAPVNAVAFAPTGHDVVSGAVDGSLRLTRDDRDPLALPPAVAGIDAVAILTGDRVAATDVGGRLRVIDVARGALLMDVAAGSRMRLLRPSLDGSRLITISTRDKHTPPALWDLAQYRLLTKLEGHRGRVFTARFVANQREFLTTGEDGTVRRWDTATGSLQRTYRGDSHFLTDATLAPDATLVVAGDSTGQLRFWDASTGRLLWMLRAHQPFVTSVHYEGNDIITRGYAGDVASWTLPAPERVIGACHAVACASAVDAPE